MGGLLGIAFALTLSADGLAPPPEPVTPSVTTTQVTQAYDIAATLHVGTGRVDAMETLTVTNDAALPIDYLNLSVLPRAFGYVTLSGPITVDGGATTAEWTTTTNLRVALGQRLAPGATATVAIPFELEVGASGGAFTARTSFDRGVLSLGQWFPIVSREHDSYAVGDPQVSYAADRIRLDLTTTAPLPRAAVACPGLVEAPDARGTRWVCKLADARDFSVVVNPAFRVLERTVGDVTLRVHTQTVDGSRTADLAAFALTRLEDLYGPYPWPELVVAEVGATSGFSMEYPAAIHLTREKVVDTYVLYHEVAHQWFYAQLGSDQMAEPWLDEAFADFTARHLMGIGRTQCSTRDVDSPVFAWPAGLTRGGDWQSCDGYFHAVFYKGSEFLNAVRVAMGDDAFFAALREHIDANRFDITTGRHLLDHLQARTDADLAPIYARYLAAY